MVLLQDKHRTSLTLLPCRRTNFLEPQFGQIGHARNAFIFKIPDTLYLTVILFQGGLCKCLEAFSIRPAWFDVYFDLIKSIKNASWKNVHYLSMPLPRILIFSESGFSITHISLSNIAGLSNLSFTGLTETNLAAFICISIFTRHIWFSEISPL